ncbi:winged helix-turn-helix domain-containing protein [Halorussus salinus]|uniref:winged helix-turn-helix domain-containing protein n=1 Tax=Halorussus salinus TaxID=1364935 RepID=UPI0010920A20|nr:winged helix-turn-helix domain-containing protein [Halorussus salinus]
MFSETSDHALLDLYGDSPSRYKLLLVFASHPLDSFNLRDAAREADISFSTIHNHTDFLDYLVEVGLLETKGSGTTLYQLNMDSEFAQSLVEWYRMNERARHFYESAESNEGATTEFYK